MWKQADLRNWDRAVFYLEDMDGHAVIHHLAAEMGWTLGAPGKENRVETASLSRWGGLHTMDWLKKQGFTANQIRGSVIIHHSVIDEDLKEALFLVVRKIYRLQS